MHLRTPAEVKTNESARKHTHAHEYLGRGHSTFAQLKTEKLCLKALALHAKIQFGAKHLEDIISDCESHPPSAAVKQALLCTLFISVSL